MAGSNRRLHPASGETGPPRRRAGHGAGRATHGRRFLGQGTDPESQLLEDVVCLVFLKYYFDDFAIEHEEEKLIRIVKQTWKKMSPSGHKAALELRLSESASNLIEKALK